MPYSFPNNPPQWASKKSDAVQKVAIEVFNTTFNKTKSEQQARIASLAAMQNAEKEFKARAAGKQVTKSHDFLVSERLVGILKAKYTKCDNYFT